MDRSTVTTIRKHLYRQTYRSGHVSYFIRLRKLYEPGEWAGRFQTEAEAAEFLDWCLEQREIHRKDPQKNTNYKSYEDKPCLKGWGGIRCEI